MATRIYKTPFAATGDKESLATADQPDGKVSLQAGWTPDYELPNDNPAYRPVGRTEMNGILSEITESLGEVQQYGYAVWRAITGGWPNGARVYYGGNVFVSLSSGNQTEPGVAGSSWKLDVSPDATATAKGIIQLASAAEATAGANTTKAITPALLKQETDKRAPASHTHEMGQVLGLIAALAAKLNTAGGNPALTSSAGIELGLRAADGYGSYVKGYKGSTESWYVGTGTTTTDDVLISSYIHNTYLRLMSDRVAVNRPLYVGNNVVYHAGNLPAAADATTAAKGIVQLATLAEANAGVNTAKAMTPALVRSIGIGQNWTDVTAARASGTVYTNTTSRPIFVCVCATTQISAVVSGVEILISQAGENNAYFIVQPGGGYMAISSNIRKWSELR